MPVPPASPTQIVGQQVAPHSTVPAGPPGGTLAPAAGQTNTLAIISLVAAAGSFVAHVVPGLGGFTVALVALITAYMARGQIKKTGEGGWGLTTAALIIAYIHLALIALGVLLVILAIFWFGVTLFGISRH
jgi:hypothetical protein